MADSIPELEWLEPPTLPCLLVYSLSCLLTHGTLRNWMFYHLFSPFARYELIRQNFGCAQIYVAAALVPNSYKPSIQEEAVKCTASYHPSFSNGPDSQIFAGVIYKMFKCCGYTAIVFPSIVRIVLQLNNIWYPPLEKSLCARWHITTASPRMTRWRRYLVAITLLETGLLWISFCYAVERAEDEKSMLVWMVWHFSNILLTELSMVGIRMRILILIALLPLHGAHLSEVATVGIYTIVFIFCLRMVWQLLVGYHTCRVKPPIQHAIAWSDTKLTDYQEDNCIICWRDWKDDEHAAILWCGHVYHESCLNQWWQRPGPIKCPKCDRGLLDQIKGQTATIPFTNVMFRKL